MVFKNGPYRPHEHIVSVHKVPHDEVVVVLFDDIERT